MATYFVDPSVGNDANDGFDILGLSLANATYDHADNVEGDRHLSLASAFAGYSFSSGDLIYLVNAVGGVADGLYEIASKVDADAILLVADAGLTSDSTSDVDSSSGPWASTQKALDVAVAGDTTRLCKTATETTAAIIDADTNNGSAGNTISLYSYDSLGTTQEDGYILRCSGAVNNLILWAGSQGQFQDWLGVDFDGDATNTAALLDLNLTDAGAGSQFHRCIVRRSGGDGAKIRGLSVRFLDCDVHSNAGVGLATGTTSASRWTEGVVYKSKVHDNGDDGLLLGLGPAAVIGCEIYDNAGAGINLGGSTGATLPALIDNTIYGNTGDGIDGSGIVATTGIDAVTGNTIVSNQGSAWTLGSIDTFMAGYNHAHDNTTSNSLPGENNQSGDPLFTSVVDGSEDFAPQTGSPLIQNGINRSNIGAVAHADGGGGGGGLLTHPGMTGGMRG